MISQKNGICNYIMEISNILLTFSIEKGLSERIKEAIKSFFEKSSWNTEKLEKFFSYY